MTESAQRDPADQPGSTVTALRSEQQPAVDAAQLVAEHNQQNKTHEKQYAQTRQATDTASRAAAVARQADAARDDAEATHEAIQAENPDRHAPRPRQWAIACGALLLDGVACYFAAEALGAGQQETVAWAALFLALLGIGEIALDHYSEDHRAAWRWVAVALAGFIGLLGVLRYSFLVTVGAEGLATAAIGTVLFTAATAGFVLIGYRALRLAEGGRAWRARRQLRAMQKSAVQAHHRLDQTLAQRDRLASAYLARIRVRLVRTCSSGELAQLERALRAHLIGEDTP